MESTDDSRSLLLLRWAIPCVLATAFAVSVSSLVLHSQDLAGPFTALVVLVWWVPSAVGSALAYLHPRFRWWIGGTAISMVMLAYTIRYVPQSNEDGIWLFFGLFLEGLLFTALLVFLSIESAMKSRKLE